MPFFGRLSGLVGGHALRPRASRCTPRGSRTPAHVTAVALWSHAASAQTTAGFRHLVMSRVATGEEAQKHCGGIRECIAQCGQGSTQEQKHQTPSQGMRPPIWSRPWAIRPQAGTKSAVLQADGARLQICLQPGQEQTQGWGKNTQPDKETHPD